MNVDEAKKKQYTESNKTLRNPFSLQPSWTEEGEIGGSFMRFIYGKQDMRTLDRAQENCFLLTNGLGGYASVTAACSVNRADQAILAAAVKAPNERITLVHRLREQLTLDGTDHFLTTQAFE